MRTLRVKDWMQRWWWALLFVAFYSIFLDAGLNEPDEGRYAEIAREMAEGGDWFTPHQNGIPHFQKPPLIYWLSALSLKVFGVHAWAARLPSFLAALGTLALTAWLAGMLFGRGTRRAAILVLATSAGFYALGRLLTPDMLLTFWTTAAIAFGVRRCLGGDTGWGLAFFVAMGLGFMSKGPMAVVIPVSAILGLRYNQPKAERQSLPWFTGAILTLIIGLWWFMAQSFTDRRLFEYFFYDELVARFASGHHGRSKPFWFFAAILPVAFLPWTLLLRGIGRDVWRLWKNKTPLGPAGGLLFGWIVPPLLMLSVSGSKLPTYILPLLPGLALGVVFWWRERGENTAFIHGLAASMAIILTILAGLRNAADPILRQQSSTVELAALARAQPDFSEATLFAAQVRAQGFTFGIGRLVSVTESEADVVLTPTPRQRARLFRDTEALERAMSSEKVAYGITRRANVPSAFPPDRWRELGTEGDFVLLGKQ